MYERENLDSDLKGEQRRRYWATNAATPYLLTQGFPEGALYQSYDSTWRLRGTTMVFASCASAMKWGFLWSETAREKDGPGLPESTYVALYIAWYSKV